MKKEIKYLLVELAKDRNMTLDFVAAAQKLLEEEFEEEVKEFLDSNYDRINEIYEIVRSEIQKQKKEEK